MKTLLLSLLFAALSVTSFSQFTLYKEVEGVQFYTKWGREKWYSKKSPKILLVKIVNTGSSAAQFDMGVEFFANMVMIEESPEKNYCLSSGKTLAPRIAGLVFKPAAANPENLDSFELTGLEISKLDRPGC